MVKQKAPAQLPLEADFVALSYAVREAIWMHCLMREFFNIKNNIRIHATVFFGDNERVLNLAYMEMSSEKTKHIPVKFFVYKEKV